MPHAATVALATLTAYTVTATVTVFPVRHTRMRKVYFSYMETAVRSIDIT